MEFLGVGYQEVMLVLVLMLIVVGPKRMPEVAYHIGRAVREMQKYARAVRDEFSDEWEYLDSQAKELRGEVDAASKDMQEIRQSLRSETSELDAELKSVSRSVEEAIPTDKPEATVADKPATPPNGKATNAKPEAAKPAAAKPTLSNANVSINGRQDSPLAGKAKAGGLESARPAANVRQSTAKDSTATPAVDKPTEETAAPAESETPKPPLVF